MFLTENLGGTRGLVSEEVPHSVQREVFELEIAYENVEAALTSLSYFLLLLVNDLVYQIVHLQFLFSFLAEQITLEKKLYEVIEDFNDVFYQLIGNEFVRRKLSDFLRQNFPEVEIRLTENFIKVSYVNFL